MIRLLHISDLHFGPPHRDDMDQAVRHFVESRQPDAVLVSGDITQRATPVQFQAARRFLDSLSVPKVVVPGNHDVPLWAVHERLLTPLGRWRRSFSPITEPTLQLPGLWVYGINTAKGFTQKGGTFRQSSLERMRTFFAAAPKGTLRVVVAHHHLVPATRRLYDPVASRGKHAANAFADARVDLVVSGHLHHGFMRYLRDVYPRPDCPTLVLHSGTTMSSRGRHEEAGRNSMNLIVADAGKLRVEQLRHDGWDRFVVQETGEFSREPDASSPPVGNGPD